MQECTKGKLRSTVITSSILRLGVLTVLIGAGVSADTPEYYFNGRWRIDTTNVESDIKPTNIRLAAGRFSKDSDDIVAADGRFYRVSGGGYIDETSITIQNDYFVREVDKVHGKIVYIVDYTVSQDGNTLTWHVSSYTSPSGQVVKSKTVQRRLGQAINGAHLVSGTWERVSITVDSKSDWILKLKGNNFSRRTAAGIGYDAILGGKAEKIDGDASGALVLVERPSPETLVETNLSAQGKPGAVLSMQLMPDKGVIRATVQNLRDKKSTTFNLRRVAE